MSDEPESDLQFERAEYEGERPASPACGACGQAIWNVYYAVNGQMLCERCKSDLDLQKGQGSRVGRFARASLYGLGAGAVGAGIWYGVRAATGYEMGLIAIVVGLMVGGAVRKGSNGRGGWHYQALAMFLTYASIVSTYVPEVVSSLGQMAENPSDATASPAPLAGSPPAAPARPSEPLANAAAGQPSAPASATSGPDPSGIQQLGLGQALFAVGVFLLVVAVIALAAPFLGGFQNIIGIVIIGIALYEAWKMNRPQPLEVSGPHRVGAPVEPEGGAAASGDAPVVPGRG